MWDLEVFHFLAFVSILAKQVIHKWIQCKKKIIKREKYIKFTVVLPTLGQPRSLESLPNQVHFWLKEEYQSSSKNSPIFSSKRLSLQWYSSRGRGQEPGSLECHSPDVQNVTNLLALEDLVYRGISLVQFVAYKKMDYF